MTLVDCFKHILDKEEITQDEEIIINTMLKYSRLNNESLIGVFVSEYNIPVTIKIKDEYYDQLLKITESQEITSSELFNTFTQLKKHVNPDNLELIKYYDDKICNIIGNMASGTWLKLVKI